MRGLKSYQGSKITEATLVAPLAGAWIEIKHNKEEHHTLNVAPLAGAWIEISKTSFYRKRRQVAPLAGAWIEIVVLDV